MELDNSSTDSQNENSTMLFCRICQSFYKYPKLLPCLHSFCRSCLVDTVTHTSEGSVIVCPVCLHTIRLSSSGVAGIPDNCFLHRMCHEYLLEVQHHLVARSLHSITAGTSSDVTPTNTSRLNYEPSRPRYSPLASYKSQFTGQDESLPEVISVDLSSASGHESTTFAIEAIQNMSRLQNKVMSLQGEALRVTYAIDQVNEYANDWHQLKEDTKRAIQRRSDQFQHFIKRVEHQLITQIDNKQTDDIFYAESNKSKTDLRKNLKNILHEVNVLKSLQELGNDTEVNALSDNLLGKSVGLRDVLIRKVHLEIDIPTKTVEEIVTAYFGEIKLNFEDSVAFTPEVVDFADVSVGNDASTLIREDYHGSNQNRDVTFQEEQDVLLVNATVRDSLKKRSSDRKSRRYNTDLGLNNQDVKDYLTQFQNARETFRTRRKEILAQGQQAREDASPIRNEIQRRPRSTSRKGRVQSLDRVAAPVVARGRTSLPNSSSIQDIRAAKSAHTRTLSSNLEEEVSSTEHESPVNSPYVISPSHFASGLIPEDRILPSSVTENVALPNSPQRKFLKPASELLYSPDTQLSPKEDADAEFSPLTNSPSLKEQLRNRRFSNPVGNVATDHGHSDQLSSLSTIEHTTLDVVKHDRTTSRPVRRAISSAADRKVKIEFLRENWQKRKEILIQNEGFVSSDAASKSAARMNTETQSVEVTDRVGKILDSGTIEAKLNSKPVSSDDPRHESMHQIRSRIAQYRNELTRMDETRQKLFKNTTTSSSRSIQDDEQLRSGLQEQNISESHVEVFPKLPPATKEVLQTVSYKQVAAATFSSASHGLPVATGSMTSVELPVATPSKSSYELPVATPSRSLPKLPAATPSISLHELPVVTPSRSSYELPVTTPLRSLPELPAATPSRSLHDIPVATPSRSSYELPVTTPLRSSYELPGTIPSRSLPELPVTTPSRSLPEQPEASPSRTSYELSEATPSSATYELHVTTVSSTTTHDLPLATASRTPLARPAAIPSRIAHELSATSLPFQYQQPLATSVTEPMPPATSSSIAAHEVPGTSSSSIAAHEAPGTTSSAISHGRPETSSVSSHELPVTSSSALHQPPATSPLIITATTRSRYSRYQTTRVESVDIASLIAAMYKGQEKSLLHTTTTTAATTTTTATTTTATITPTTSTSGTMYGAQEKSLIHNTATATATTILATTTSGNLYREQEKSLVHSANPVLEAHNQPAQTTTTTTTTTTNSSKVTESTISTVTSPTSLYRSQQENTRNKSQFMYDTQKSNLQSNEEPSQQRTNSTVGQKELGQQRNNDTVSETELGQQRNNSNVSETEDRQQIEGSSVTQTYLRQQIRNSNVSQIEAEQQIDGSSIIGKDLEQQDRNSSVSQTDDEQQIDDSNINKMESTQQSQYRLRRQGMRSRFTDGVNRRHTVEIGKAEIESALKLISKKESLPNNEQTLHSISESPSTNNKPDFTPYQGRFPESTSRNLEANNGSTHFLSPSSQTSSPEDIRGSSVAASKIRSSGLFTKAAPVSLGVIEERPLQDYRTQPTETISVVSGASPSLSPVSSNIIDSSQIGRLREIARKKKERWRHLTIH